MFTVADLERFTSGRCSRPERDWKKVIRTQNVVTVAQYMFKAGSYFVANTICPTPGSLSLEDLDHHIDALRDHQVPVRRGTRGTMISHSGITHTIRRTSLPKGVVFTTAPGIPAHVNASQSARQRTTRARQ